VLATLEGELHLVLAGSALQTQDNLLGSLGLLVEDGLGLTTITGLLTVARDELNDSRKIKNRHVYVPVITSLTLGEEGSLTSLVLGNLVGGVLLAGLALAVSVAGLGNVDLQWTDGISQAVP
jgi:hypothetical protein